MAISRNLQTIIHSLATIKRELARGVANNSRRRMLEGRLARGKARMKVMARRAGRTMASERKGVSDVD